MTRDAYIYILIKSEYHLYTYILYTGNLLSSPAYGSRNVIRAWERLQLLSSSDASIPARVHAVISHCVLLVVVCQTSSRTGDAGKKTRARRYHDEIDRIRVTGIEWKRRDVKTVRVQPSGLGFRQLRCERITSDWAVLRAILQSLGECSRCDDEWRRVKINRGKTSRKTMKWPGSRPKTDSVGFSGVQHCIARRCCDVVVDQQQRLRADGSGDGGSSPGREGRFTSSVLRGSWRFLRHVSALWWYQTAERRGEPPWWRESTRENHALRSAVRREYIRPSSASPVTRKTRLYSESD